jgi:hypothetical protein
VCCLAQHNNLHKVEQLIEKICHTEGPGEAGTCNQRGLSAGEKQKKKAPKKKATKKKATKKKATKKKATKKATKTATEDPDADDAGAGDANAGGATADDSCEPQGGVFVPRKSSRSTPRPADYKDMPAGPEDHVDADAR